jgi:HKD family nuclease
MKEPDSMANLTTLEESGGRIESFLGIAVNVSFITLFIRKKGLSEKFILFELLNFATRGVQFLLRLADFLNFTSSYSACVGTCFND